MPSALVIFLALATALVIVLSFLSFGGSSEEGQPTLAEFTPGQPPPSKVGIAPHTLGSGFSVTLPGPPPAMSNSVVAGDNGLPYLLRIPRGRNSSTTLVVFLHGAGESGAQPWGLLPGYDPKSSTWEAGVPAPVRSTPPGLAVDGSSLIEGVAVLAPQTLEGWGQGTHARIISLMDSVIETYHLNPARVVLTGISMGGAGAWLLGASFPHRFAAIAPICGYHNGGAEGIANALKSTPLYVAHGPNDGVVPHDLSAELVKAVKERGNLDVVFDQTNGTFPEGAEYMEGHDSWTRVYRSDEFWQWVRAKSGGR